MTKPRDMLEFLRRYDEDENEDETGVPVVAAQTRAPARPRRVKRPEKFDGPDTDLLVVTRRQIMISGGAGIGVMILAFLLGLAASGGDPAEERARVASPATSWVIRAITYDDSPANLAKARETERWLTAKGLGQVTLRRIPSDSQVVLVLGAWLENPERDPQALKLLRTVRDLDRRGKKPFDGAGIWQITLR